nr:MAG TPA: chromosome segregation protein [Caudoviricetes sp.]
MNNNTDGTLYIGTAIDMSGAEAGAKRLAEIAEEMGQEVGEQAKRMHDLLTDIPTVNIDVVSNAASTLDTIQQGFDEVDRVVDANKSAIRELEEEYKRLGTAANKAAQKGDAKQMQGYRQERDAIRQVIETRKKVIAEAEKTADSLAKVEQRMRAEAEQAQKAASQHVSLRGQIRALREEMATLVANGIDQQSEAYKRLVSELGRLTDIQGDIQAQGKVLANDEQHIAGLIQGLGGLSGAFSAAQGAVGLFAGENEELNKIMLKVQSLMAITMGLQQVQQTLNKDSAFSLVTLNGLKQWWNKLTAEGTVAQVAETAATEANTAAAAQNAAANTADAASKEAVSAASGQSAVSQTADTANKAVNTAAAGVNAKANITLAGTFRTLGLAIKSIPVWGWIAAAVAAIATAVGVLAAKSASAKRKATEAYDEAIKKQEEFNKAVAEKVADQITIYNKLSREYKALGGNLSAQKKFIKDNQDAFHGLGVQIGNVNDANNYLIAKSKDVVAALMAQARAAAAFDMAKQKQKELIELQNNPIKPREVSRKTVGYSSGSITGVNTYLTNKTDEQYKKDKERARKEAEKERKDAITAKQKELADLIKIEDESNKAYSDSMKKANVKAYNGKGGKSGKDDKFDKEKSLAQIKAANDEWVAAVEKYERDATNKVNEHALNVREDGLEKELEQIKADTAKKKQAWEDQLRQLAEVRMKSMKELYMARKGATESGWAKSETGKKTAEDHMKDLLADKKINAEYYRVQNNIVEQGERQLAEVRQKHADAMVEQYGTTAQKLEKLQREWEKKMADVPPEYAKNASKQMKEALAKLASEDFKQSINWEGVFGDLSKQSISALAHTRDKVQAYFEQNKGSMSGTEIKDFQEALRKMEDEIANRNPFTALHKSLDDIGRSKAEFTNAMSEWKTAQDELTASQQEYNEALFNRTIIQQQVDEGKLLAFGKEMVEANERLVAAENNRANAQERVLSAERRTVNARNGITNAYRTFASNLRNVGNVVNKVGAQAKNLASVFSADVSASIAKALDFTNEVFDATSSVIHSIGDVGKGVASGVEKAVSAAATGATTAAATGATAISTIEKASVILAVISAALQVATAIANLFNNDDSKEKEIGRLQERIDQLQWELDNAEAVRLQKNTGDAIERLKQAYQEATVEVNNMYGAISRGHGVSGWVNMLVERERRDVIAYQKTVEKLTDTYVQLDYTANKALGTKSFEEAKDRVKNLVNQQVLIKRQIDEEKSKKSSDDGKISEWERKIKELSNQAVEVINQLLEAIIGHTAEDLAKELGNAFFDAVEQGKDAMDAWHAKVKDIIADIVKRMAIKEALEKPLGDLFNKYKKVWFDDKGNFKNGSNAVMNSMNDFSRDLDNLGNTFNNFWQSLPPSIKGTMENIADREGTSKGIATASQESVDENNARLTTIQGHTYTLVQGLAELNNTSNLILMRVTGIERNTDAANAKLERMDARMKSMDDSLDDIATRGIKIKT